MIRPSAAIEIAFFDTDDPRRLIRPDEFVGGDPEFPDTCMGDILNIIRMPSSSCCSSR
jgi:hypothetical protein